MAVYKIFPVQDTTLYSSAKTTNTGLDEILEVGAYNASNQIPASNIVLAQLGLDDIRRSILLFDSNEIRAAVALSGEASASVSASLKMYLATAENLSQDYTVEAYQMVEQWQNGLGKYGDAPTNEGGASWVFRADKKLGTQWNLSNQNDFSSSFLFTSGGGSWRTQCSGTQEFSFRSDKDLNMNITSMLKSWATGSIGGGNGYPNYGLIVKLANNVELNSGSYIGLKYYSVDTHTIYPPCIEVKWDDFIFVTSSTYAYTTFPYLSYSASYSASYSSSISASVEVWATSSFTSSFTTSYQTSVVLDDKYTIVSNNNTATYKNDSIYKFSFKARDTYPTRRFTTSSVYLDWKYLPTSSYYGIQDYKTKEMFVDFDTVGTKLSISPSGSYFNLNMNGLQPERSYKILLKSELESGETVIKDQDIIFKVIR